MITNKIYTRKILGLDKRVWSVMITISVLSLGLLSYKLVDNKKCIPFNGTIKTTTFHGDSVYYVGENLTFIASTSKQDITWDFGDNTAKPEGTYVTHKFLAPGTYRIRASAGADCDWSKSIIVINVPQSTYIREGEKIMGQAAVTNAFDAEFICTELADTYTWSIKNYPGIKPIGAGEKVKFRFTLPGTYTVQVILDNNRIKTYTKEVSVEDVLKPKNKMPEDPTRLVPMDPIPDIKLPEQVPETKTEEVDNKPKFLKIPDATFWSLLESVQNNQKDITDFDKYLCSGGATKVRENTTRYITFTILCQQLSGKDKKASIKAVRLKRDDSGCIILIDIDIKKKKGFLGI